jgi:GNAT superfamily N-acetyltransferase
VSGDGIAVERVTDADLPALHGLIERAYRGDTARAGWTHEADLLGGQRTDLDALTAMLADSDQQILAARGGAALVGCVALRRIAVDRCYLGLLTVEPTLQAAGLGRRLLAEAEAAARAWGMTFVEMTVIARRAELVAWYERREYRLTGERRPFPMENPRFGLPKTEDLDFVVLEKRLVRSS